MRFLYKIGLVALILIQHHVFAQVDSTNILSLEEFLKIVVTNHPVVKKSKLISKEGELGIQNARGKFDPVLYNYFNGKNYNSKNYYNINSGGLKIPTWYGIEFNANMDNNQGTYLNPENNVPKAGLISSGVSVSLGKGLFIDERRKTLKQAKIYSDISENEQFLMINSILSDAICAYWEWAADYNKLTVAKEAIINANERFKGVKKSFVMGSKPEIDTIESLLFVQNREYALNEAELDYKKSSLFLSNYLWDENEVPLEISESLAAPNIVESILEDILEFDIDTLAKVDLMAHPILKNYNYELNILKIEKRYKAENLKPQLNLKYNFITEQVGMNSVNNFNTNDYKLGVEFKIPIFLREQRSDFAKSKLKIQKLEYSYAFKQKELKSKMEAYAMELKTLQQQNELYKNTTINYNKLYFAEKRKFEIGESSIFLINYREAKLLEARNKQLEIISKFNKTKAKLIETNGQNLLEN